jgi:hypothetical protein
MTNQSGLLMSSRFPGHELSAHGAWSIGVDGIVEVLGQRLTASTTDRHLLCHHHHLIHFPLLPSGLRLLHPAHPRHDHGTTLTTTATTNDKGGAVGQDIRP